MGAKVYAVCWLRGIATVVSSDGLVAESGVRSGIAKNRPQICSLWDRWRLVLEQVLLAIRSPLEQFAAMPFLQRNQVRSQWLHYVTALWLVVQCRLYHQNPWQRWFSQGQPFCPLEELRRFFDTAVPVTQSEPWIVVDFQRWSSCSIWGDGVLWRPVSKLGGCGRERLGWLRAVLEAGAQVLLTIQVHHQDGFQKDARSILQCKGLQLKGFGWLVSWLCKSRLGIKAWWWQGVWCLAARQTKSSSQSGGGWSVGPTLFWLDFWLWNRMFLFVHWQGNPILLRWNRMGNGKLNLSVVSEDLCTELHGAVRSLSAFFETWPMCQVITRKLYNLVGGVPENMSSYVCVAEAIEGHGSSRTFWSSMAGTSWGPTWSSLTSPWGLVEPKKPGWI